MNQLYKQNLSSGINRQTYNNSIKYSTINQSNNNIQEILNKYSNYSKKIKHSQIYNPQYINSSSQKFNFSTIRLITDPNRTFNNNRYINNN